MTLSLSDVETLWFAAANLYREGLEGAGTRLAVIALRGPEPDKYAQCQKDRFIKLYGADRFMKLLK